MDHRRIKAGIVAGAACALLGAPAPASAVVRECGNYDGQRWTHGEIVGAGIFGVVGRNVTCRTARHVALHAFETYRDPSRKTWRYRRWKCKVRRTGYESSSVRCTRSGRCVVRWTTGA